MLLRTIASAYVIALLSTLPVEATVLYVAANGSGTTCDSTTPCKTIPVAIGAASVGDTIVCLSPPLSGDSTSNFISITKSLTIDCLPAGAAVIGGLSQNGQGYDYTPVAITINVAADDPLKKVRLRGLTVDGGYRANLHAGAGPTLNRGIEIQSAVSVYIEDCVISNVRQQGIYDHRTGGQTKLFVKDTVISGNGGPGIVAASQATAATVLDNVSLLNNSYGIATAAGNNVIISRSTISGNTIAGVEADGGAQVEVTNSLLSHNTLHVQAFGTIRLRENDLKFSNTAIQGATVSMGANRFSGNGSLGSTPTPASGASADVFN